LFSPVPFLVFILVLLLLTHFQIFQIKKKGPESCGFEAPGLLYRDYPIELQVPNPSALADLVAK